jgi:hypothetical protein
MAPARTEEARRLFGIALSIKRGETPRSTSVEAAALADENTEAFLSEMASKPTRRRLT